MTLAAGPEERLPAELVVHVGSATVGARLRPLDGAVVRLRLASPLPLRVGDRLLLRDPGTRRVLGADVRDVDPPELRRRGAARQRAAELAAQPGGRGAAADLARRRVVRADDFTAMGWPVPRGRHGARAVAMAAGPGRRAGRPGAAASSPRYRRRIRWSPGRRRRWCAGCWSCRTPSLVARWSGRRWSCARGGWSTASAGLPPEVQQAVDADPGPARRRSVRRARGR